MFGLMLKVCVGRVIGWSAVGVCVCALLAGGPVIDRGITASSEFKPLR